MLNWPLPTSLEASGEAMLFLKCASRGLLGVQRRQRDPGCWLVLLISSSDSIPASLIRSISPLSWLTSDARDTPGVDMEKRETKCLFTYISSDYRGTWDQKRGERPSLHYGGFAWIILGCPGAHKHQGCYESPKNHLSEHTVALSCSSSLHMSPHSEGDTSISDCNP